MSALASPVSGKPVWPDGSQRAWRASIAIAHDRTRNRHDGSGPAGALSNAALTAAIRAVLAASSFHGEGHRTV
jgi:hypothetical protein